MNRFLTLFYGFIRFLQEILLDFTTAGEVYYNRFRMEQRAACRGAILHLFKFVITIGVCNNGIVCQNLSAQEAPAREGAWLPFPYVYQERPQGSCPPPRPRPREADRFQSRLIDLTISARQSAAPVPRLLGAFGPARQRPGAGLFLSFAVFGVNRGERC